MIWFHPTQADCLAVGVNCVGYLSAIPQGLAWERYAAFL